MDLTKKQVWPNFVMQPLYILTVGGTLSEVIFEAAACGDVVLVCSII